MSTSLKSRILHTVQHYTARHAGAWLVWCDPRGDWAPLLRVALADGGIALLEIEARVAGHLGGPVDRVRLQQRIAGGETFVLRVAAGHEDLGWLWAHALRAEYIYQRPLRNQLIDWGWRPQVLHLSDEEVRALAEQNLDLDPAAWGSGGLEPNVDLLLNYLLIGAEVEGTQRVVLNLSADRAGLGQPDMQHPEAWRMQAVARILVTDAARHAPDRIPDSHELLVDPMARPLVWQLIDRWLDSRLYSELLPRVVTLADPIAGLDAVTGDADARYGPFLSRRAELMVYTNTCKHVASLTGTELLATLAQLQPVLAAHTGHRAAWADAERVDEHAIPWKEFARLSRACEMLLAASPTGRWAGPQAALDWYIGGGWQVDQAGEELLRNVTSHDAALIGLLNPLRTAFRARWEQQLMAWSDVWQAAGCPQPVLPTAGERLITFLEARRPTAIVIIDALRYDLGQELARLINAQESSERAQVTPARAPLPSITALGMGMALPIPAATLIATCDESGWALRAHGQAANLSQAAARRAWWTEHGHAAADALLNVQTVLNQEVPKPTKSRPRLVVADHTLDDQGHDGELEAAGTAEILRRYVQVIQRLRDAGWLRIAVVTDHGYIHWTGQHDQHVAPPEGSVVYRSRRAYAYRAGSMGSGTTAMAPGDIHPVAAPAGASCFVAYGKRGYYHGGASLQEWIIPMLTIDWPARIRPVEFTLRQQQTILAQRVRITLDVPPVMFPDEYIAREVKAVILHAETRELLFVSTPKLIYPTERPEVCEELFATVRSGAAAARGTSLMIEVRDASTDAVLASTPSRLMIELRQTARDEGW
ncbi:MAG: PglZ domain-containing protein [Candidatus Viridilinea halotolerans]|uniref:PglZ domain-containing protein n=1 Tax=Candidatus Viridilinea halotolerans TaxID=2491704 RepID=A0A426U2Z5_9CHLR|nr:MAG: PglZ domain-containing protein [Candidatus Viridilinea halotolerans]